MSFPGTALTTVKSRARTDVLGANLGATAARDGRFYEVLKKTPNVPANWWVFSVDWPVNQGALWGAEAFGAAETRRVGEKHDSRLRFSPSPGWTPEAPYSRSSAAA